jgi:hypothetical protein
MYNLKGGPDLIRQLLIIKNCIIESGPPCTLFSNGPKHILRLIYNNVFTYFEVILIINKHNFALCVFKYLFAAFSFCEQHIVIRPQSMFHGHFRTRISPVSKYTCILLDLREAESQQDILLRLLKKC